MPCPKCGHLLITEDGVEYCEECLHVTKRKGDPRYDTTVTEETDIRSRLKPTPKPLTRKRGRPKKHGRRKKVRYRKQVAKGKTCTTEKCGWPVHAKGLCKRCYQRGWERLRRDTKISDYRGPRFVFRSCSVPECGRKHWAKGYCKKHYSLYVARRPDYSCTAHPEERKCALCPRLHYAKGLCKRHYNIAYGFDIKWKHLDETRENRYD